MTSGDEDGITLCCTAISCYFLHRMILLHFVSFVCAFAHVLAGTFGNPAIASPLLGSVGEFDPSSEAFTAYLERLDQFFVANDIGKCADDTTATVVRAANQKKVAVMISVIGKKTYSTLRDLCSPENPKKNHLRYYVNYYNTSSPNDWTLPNPTDFIDVVKKKMRACRFTVLV